MTSPAFAFRLRDNLFLDSDGNLHEGPPTDTTVLPGPATLPHDIDISAFTGAFSSVKKALDDINGLSDTQKNDLKSFGLTPDAFAALASIGKAVKTLSYFVGAAGVAIQLFNLFALDEKEKLGIYFKELYAKLEALDAEGRALDNIDKLLEYKATILLATNQSRQYVELMKTINPALDNLLRARDSLEDFESQNLSVAVGQMLHRSWNSIVDGSKYEKLWNWRLDEGSDSLRLKAVGGTHPVTGQAKSITQPSRTNFDHRLMVTSVSFAILTYLEVIRAINPKYRSKGTYRLQLAQFSKRTSELALRLLTEGLGRFIYTQHDFRGLLWTYQPSHKNHLKYRNSEGVSVAWDKYFGRWKAGAFDVIHHDDFFFASGYARGAVKGGLTWDAVPTDVAEIVQVGDWKTTPSAVIENWAECATVWNDIGKSSFNGVLVRSGYFELLKLAALLKDQATPPLLSETVAVKHQAHNFEEVEVLNVTASDRSNPLAQGLESESILFKGNYDVQVDIETDKPLVTGLSDSNAIFSVYLRALSLSPHAEDALDGIYSAFYGLKYHDNPDIPGQALIRAEHDPSVLVSEHRLVNNYRSTGNTTPIDFTSSVKLKVRTFEWWVPQPANRSGSPYNDGFEEVEIGVRLTWHGSSLSVYLRSGATNKSHLLYLVVEETRDGNPISVHTSIPLMMLTQEMQVPKEFIDSFRRASRVPDRFRRPPYN